MTITPLADAGTHDAPDLADAVLAYLERIECDDVQAFISAMTAFEQVQAARKALRRGALRLRGSAPGRMAELHEEHSGAVAEFLVFESAADLLRRHGATGLTGGAARGELLRKVRAGMIPREEIEGAAAVPVQAPPIHPAAVHAAPAHAARARPAAAPRYVPKHTARKETN